MADFGIAFDRTMKSEGGYVLHTVPGDRGGMTFAGISRKYHPDWNGWQLIDSGERGTSALLFQVEQFYLEKYWDRLLGDDIENQPVANVLFDFSVNAGIKTAVKLAQRVLRVSADGIAGVNTVKALNSIKPEQFIAEFALVKVARYAAIVNRDRSQGKFLLGWVNRTLRDLETA